MNKPVSEIYLILLLVFYSCESEVSCAYDPCQNTKKEIIVDSSITNTDERGHDLDFYHVVSSPNIKKKPIANYNFQNFLEDRSELFKSLVLDLCKQTNDKQCFKYIKNFNSNVFNPEEIANGTSNHYNIIRIGKEKATFDCRTCEHTHLMTIIMAKNEIYRVPEEIRALIEKYIREDKVLEDSIRTMLSVGNTKIDLSTIINNIYNNHNFYAEIKPLLSKYHDVLNYFDVETQNILKGGDVNFPIGEFKLNIVSTLTLDHIYENLENLIAIDPSKKFLVTIRGFTDQARVRGKGIQYSDRARFSPKKNIITSKNEFQYDPIGKYIINNLQLSYARAFTGYYFFKGKLEVNENFKRNNNLILAYQGMGVDPNAINMWAKRRLEFTVEEKK